jgi:CrcB protein
MRIIVAIAVGGALGALARWGLSAALPPVAGFPVGIFVVNLSGSLIAGFLLPWLPELEVSPELRLGITTGILGGYTTFSTWQGGVYGLLAAGHAGTGLAYLGATLLGGLLTCAGGVIFARALIAGRASGDGA